MFFLHISSSFCHVIIILWLDLTLNMNTRPRWTRTRLSLMSRGCLLVQQASHLQHPLQARGELQVNLKIFRYIIISIITCRRIIHLLKVSLIIIPNVWYNTSCNPVRSIAHFRVLVFLCLKTSLRAKLFKTYENELDLQTGTRKWAITLIKEVWSEERESSR